MLTSHNKRVTSKQNIANLRFIIDTGRVARGTLRSSVQRDLILESTKNAVGLPLCVGNLGFSKLSGLRSSHLSAT